MTNKDLRVKVRRILGQFEPSERIYRHTEKELFAERLRLSKNPDDKPAVDFDVTTVVNEQVMLVKTLAAQGGHSEADFVKIVSQETNEDNAPVVVHALIELGQLKAVLAMLQASREEADHHSPDPVVTLKKHLYGPDLSFPGAIWEALGEKLRREPHLFTDADLDAIEEVRKVEERSLRLQQKRRLSDASSV